MRRLLGIFVLCFFVSLTCLGLPSETAHRVLTLEEAIALARTGSLDAALALNRLRSAYWSYRSYRAELLPEVSFDGDLPYFKRGFNLYQRPDGSYDFLRTNMLQLNGTLSIAQNIPWTGGRVGIFSSLQTVFPLASDSKARFLGTPVGVTLEQPLFAANDIKWKRRIEPLRYQEAMANYFSQIEGATIEVIRLFFNLLQAQATLETAEQNERTMLQLLEIAKVKRENGDLSENALRQMELNRLNARSRVLQQHTAWIEQMFALQRFLGLPASDTIQALLPENYPAGEIRVDEALEHASANNSFYFRRKRQETEARYEVAKTKGAQFGAKLRASVGLNAQGEQFQDAYLHPIDYQEVSLGISIPILDWQKRRGQVKMAQWNQQVVESRLAQDLQLYEQNLQLLVLRFNRQNQLLGIALEADSIAQARYNTSIEIFLYGQIGILELNDAFNAKDQARFQRIEHLFRYWSYFYQIRMQTLFDFTGKNPIEREVEAVLLR